MYEAWKKVQTLVARNAQHRDGWRLQYITKGGILAHAQQELTELCADPGDPAELADLFGVLIHFAVKQGWSQSMLEGLVIDKLAKRFTTPGEGG